MLPRVFPEEPSGEGGTQLAGRHPDRDAALHRARHMVPKASSIRDSTPGYFRVRSYDLSGREFCEWDGDKLIYILTE